MKEHFSLQTLLIRPFELKMKLAGFVRHLQRKAAQREGKWLKERGPWPSAQSPSAQLAHMMHDAPSARISLTFFAERKIGGS